MRRVLRSSVMVSTAIAAALIAGCGSDDGRVDRYASAGWPAMHADARNSDTSPVTGSRDVEFAWSRPLGGPVAAYASVARERPELRHRPHRETAAISSRSRWIRVARSGALDSTDGVVASDAPSSTLPPMSTSARAARMMSFTETGQFALAARSLWATPLSSQFTGDGNLLFITQLGQINVLDPQDLAQRFFRRST